MALCEAVGLSRRFGGITALEQVTIRIEPATILALIGPNGSGKTTLFNLLAGQLRPSAGTVRWRGQEITTWPPHRRCQAGINRTFQVAQPFMDLTLCENVALGLLYGRPAGHGRRRRDALGQARDVLGEVGLGEKAGEIARRLSLGDLKRLELATAVATQPALLLVDEILAGQSPTSAHQILGFLSGLRAKGVAVCLIEHRLQTLLPVADQVVALHQGRVIADGGPEAVIKSPAVLEAYLGEPVP